jgi:NlpE C-terminal OB domain
MIRAYKIFLIFFLILISGCQEKEQENTNIKTDTSKKIETNKKTVSRTNELHPKLFKGMYSSTANESSLVDCDTKTKYLLTQKGELEEFEKIYSAMQSNKKQTKKVYIETEGFTSVQAKPKGKGFDTVLVVTRFVKFDPEINCEK